MQSYTEINENTIIKNSRELLLNNDKTALSNSSGTSFPTQNVQIGQLCFRTDVPGLYQYIALNTWKKLFGIVDGNIVFENVPTYVAATSNDLGLVKIGSNITNNSGKISLTKANVIAALGYTPPTQDLTQYLPLSGGAMTGTKINRDVDTSVLALGGGSTAGGLIELYGKNFSTAPALKGGFSFYTNDGTNSKILRGLPNGTLTWGNANILTDAQGGYLPLSGGTLTGNELKRNTDYNQLDIAGGTLQTTSARLWLSGGNRAAAGGYFFLAANDGNNSKTLEGRPDGTLNWDGNDLGGSAIVAKSLGTTGYSKRADGLIEQWGQTSNVARWDFPITFPNAVIGVYAGINYNGEQSGYDAVKTLTTSYLEPTLQSPLVTTYWRVLGY